MIGYTLEEGQVGQPEAEFEAHRCVLLGLAYRLLGSMWDAEDVVQEAFLRWLGAEREHIRDPRAFLVTVVTRLALDQLRSARVTREAYPGPWLPEPVSTATLGPLDTAELRDTVAYATLHLMERLSPPERAVFVLREAFALAYDEISGIVGLSAAACRQAHHRAGRRLAAAGTRFHPSGEEHARLVASFLAAARGGDLDGLARTLSEDVVVWNDGGGRVRAALRPIVGRGQVVAFLAGLLTRYGLEPARVVDANGAPALWTGLSGQGQLVSFATGAGRIHAIYAVLNPDKLAHARPD